MENPVAKTIGTCERKRVVMIKDSVANVDLYSSVSRRLAGALSYLETVSADMFEEETVEIEGQDVYAMHQLYETKSEEGRLYESHVTYIDVQCVLRGSEVIRVRDAGDLDVTTAYNAENDVTLYQLDDGTDVRLVSGDFVVLFPHDAHVPQLQTDRPSQVKKIVIKVRV